MKLGAFPSLTSGAGKGWLLLAFTLARVPLAQVCP